MRFPRRFSNRFFSAITIVFMDLVQIESARKTPAPKPEWLRARAPMGENYHGLKRLARSLNLHTVCETPSAPTLASAGITKRLPS